MLGPAGGPGAGGQETGRSGAVRPGEAPSISYMEGAFVGCSRFHLWFVQ